MTDKANEYRWGLMCVAIALSGVIGMGVIGKYGFNRGEEAGRIQGQSEVISALGQESMQCVPPAKVRYDDSHCHGIYETYDRLTVKFHYGK